MFTFFFFQAEDGIRDGHVTGVQTCALPICTEQESVDLPAGTTVAGLLELLAGRHRDLEPVLARSSYLLDEIAEIGRASCRERMETWVGERSFRKRTQ